MRYADLDPVFEELKKEDRIIRLIPPTGKEMIIPKKTDRHILILSARTPEATAYFL
jgi:hypothetical protein